jgi:chemotaxis receptor (MCP) glutamine deamidase CheD
MTAGHAPFHRLKHLRLPEFSHMSSYWDPIQNVEVVRILAGEYYVTHCQEMITTVLGSCISACIRDKVANIGGMNHFMLPEETRPGDLNRDIAGSVRRRRVRQLRDGAADQLHSSNTAAGAKTWKSRSLAAAGSWAA